MRILRNAQSAVSPSSTARNDTIFFVYYFDKYENVNYVICRNSVTLFVMNPFSFSFLSLRYSDQSKCID